MVGKVTYYNQHIWILQENIGELCFALGILKLHYFDSRPDLIDITKLHNGMKMLDLSN